ncbi:DNA-binding bromodomain-containing protein [Abeliophyllum distichum]|uniref:DNA-binding bromodomain-containing protein n=1 Tax=Abeliophyllum distichum TaxID=126358 RepID=A0ABD1RRR2_9LAMI
MGDNPAEFDNDDVDSGMDAETTPSPSGTDQPDKLAKADPAGRPNHDTFGKAVYTRVKVKIKTSKTLDSQHTSSDAPTQSDTDMSSQQVGSQKLGVLNEKMEDSANSFPETNVGVSMNPSRKSLGIKIKSSRGLGSSSMSPCSNVELVKGDKTENKDLELLHQDSKYYEQELKAALEVIRKVMKMEAAEPFNVPVNPVALGIPDYFDVIDTPMDFGTICSNLEKGDKYMNAEDVFKDVQYIWENCYKYNNKGDYIVELMKRVKKNFTKCWAAAGLFGDQPQETSGVEGNQMKDATPSSHENTPGDGGSSSFAGKKFHGLKKHKDGCLCAICVMMRRRQEREEVARTIGGQTEGSDDSLDEEIKAEGVSHGGSPFGEYTSSNMENSPDADADTGRKGQEMKLGDLKNLYGQQRENITIAGEGSQDLQISQRSRDENNRHYRTPHLGSGGNVPSDSWKEMPLQHEDEGAAIDQQKPKEVLDKNQRAKMLENLRYLENPMLLELYGTLFSENNGSFWSGPHSLGGRRGLNRKSSIHEAIATFMK